jgi:hypothetical protein
MRTQISEFDFINELHEIQYAPQKLQDKYLLELFGQKADHKEIIIQQMEDNKNLIKDTELRKQRGLALLENNKSMEDINELLELMVEYREFLKKAVSI